MKVLHVTTSSKGGAGIAALRLHNALIENGISSAYLSSNQTINFENKVIDDVFFYYKKPSLLRKLINKIRYVLFPSPKQLIEKEFYSLCKKMQFEMATLPFSNYLIHEHPLVAEADLINLHWIDGIVDYPTFFTQCNKPIVWTLHDMNPFLGVFHYKNDEMNNHLLASTFDSKIKNIKRVALSNIKKGSVVSPSNWLLNEAHASGVFANWTQYEIANSIDLTHFKWIEKESLRAQYAIDQHQFVLLFVSDAIDNNRKGFDLLLEALSLLNDPTILIVTIGKNNTPIQTPLKVVSLGSIHSSEKMAECFALADVFVLPSREDNLPNVMLESFACGKPIVGFAVGGIAQYTIPNQTGTLAHSITPEALKQAIVEVKNNKEQYDWKTIRAHAENNFGTSKQAKAYVKVYEQLLM